MLRHRTIACLGALLIAPLLLLPSGSSSAASTRPLSEQGVHVIGDSIARGVHRTALSSENRPPRWTVEARGGRRMTALGTYYIPPTNVYARYVRTSSRSGGTAPCAPPSSRSAPTGRTRR